jgi:hypothetical protein
METNKKIQKLHHNIKIMNHFNKLKSNNKVDTLEVIKYLQ